MGELIKYLVKKQDTLDSQSDTEEGSDIETNNDP